MRQLRRNLKKSLIIKHKKVAKKQIVIYYRTEHLIVQFYFGGSVMQQSFNIYCEKKDFELLTEILRDGMEVKKIRPLANEYVELSAVPKKKRGRKTCIALSKTEIRNSYASGISVKNIAKKAGCTERYIWKLLKEEKERVKQNEKE